MRKSWITTVIVLLLIVGQFHTILHAAEFGSERHYHESEVCTSLLPEEEYDLNALPQCPEQLFNFTLQTTLKPRPQVFAFVLHGLLPPYNGPP